MNACSSLLACWEGTSPAGLATRFPNASEDCAVIRRHPWNRASQQAAIWDSVVASVRCTPWNRRIAILASVLALFSLATTAEQNSLAAGAEQGGAAPPIAFAHAHNDYWHERPLLDALDNGFTSVEADVFLKNGRLLVGHDEHELRPERTLEALYLKPLAQRAKAHDGSIYAQPGQLFLLIDIKSDGDECYPVLDDLLSRYASTLTHVRDGRAEPGAVTVVISGNRPKQRMAEDEHRFAGYDGRLDDLQSDAPAHLMPMISDRWTSQFGWTGKGPMPPDERERLHEITRQAHDAGRVVRFWATPESEAVWQELLDADVDLLNTDQLARMAQFAKRRGKSAADR